jgi:hypothetical protein
MALSVLALWAWVFLTGGAKLWLGTARLSLRSHWRIAAVALAIVTVRHAVRTHPPFMTWLVRPHRRPGAAPAAVRWWQGPWGALLLVASAWAIMTWPQVTGMSRLIGDLGDPIMKLWQLSWVSHQLLRDPLHIYDANIFFPEAGTLAYSDAMIAPSLIAAPLMWLGAGDVLVFNLLLAAGFILSGVAMFALVRRVTADWRAGMFAALAFTFLPYRFNHYGHLELQFTWGIPLALWALHQVFETGRLRDGALLGLSVGLQAACSLYYAAYLGVFLVAVGAVLWVGSSVKGRSVRALAAGVLVAGLCAGPVLLPHAASRRSVGERRMAEVAYYSATPANYLAPNEGNRVYHTALGRFGEHEKRLFPGFLLVALAVVGAWPLRSGPRLAYVVGSLLAFDASLGANGFVYMFLFEHVPPFHGFRVAARFGAFTAAGLVVLAGFGFARLCSRAGTGRGRSAAAAMLAVGLLLEYRSFPMALFEVPRSPPPVYGWLSLVPKTVIAELPATHADDFWYMYWSRLHWHPLLNGHSGFFPPWYEEFYRMAQRFPDAVSVAFLRSRGVRHVVVHLDKYPEAARADVERRLGEWESSVWTVATFPGNSDRVLEIR